MVKQLKEYADILKTHGKDILRGNFDIFGR
jgi:hypothetical protein